MGALLRILSFLRPGRQRRVDRIRQEMLLLVDLCDGVPTGHLRSRVRFASDAVDLWYLRLEVLQALTAQAGELKAWQDVESLRPLFEGLVPCYLTRVCHTTVVTRSPGGRGPRPLALRQLGRNTGP